MQLRRSWPRLALPGVPGTWFDGRALKNAPEFPPPPVWQPLTFGGVAAFARARWPRLLLVQAVVAVAVMVAVLMVLGRGWFPVVTDAVRALTDFGAVRAGRLAWPKTEAVMLAENRFLGLALDLEETGAAGQIADLQVEFGRERIKVVSLLGYVALPYPVGVEIELSRQVLDPWWNAWRPAFWFAGGLGVLAWLAASWGMLATLYAVPVWVLARLAGRVASAGKCWRLAAAALLPGALWMGGAILLYAAEQLSLAGLGLAFGVHVVIGWVYLVGAPFCLPRQGEPPVTAGANPFTPAPPEEKAEPPPPEPAGENPFQGGPRA